MLWTAALIGLVLLGLAWLTSSLIVAIIGAVLFLLSTCRLAADHLSIGVGR